MSDFEDLLRRIIREEVLAAIAEDRTNQALAKAPIVPRTNAGVGPKADRNIAEVAGPGWKEVESASLHRGSKTFTLRKDSVVRCDKDSGVHGLGGIWVVVGIKCRGVDTNVEIRQAWNLPSRTFRIEHLTYVLPSSKDAKTALRRMRRG